jgi:type II secretion system protein D
LRLRTACLASSLIISLCIVPFAFSENGAQVNPVQPKPQEAGKPALQAVPAEAPPAGTEKPPAEAKPAGVKPAGQEQPATEANPAEEKATVKEKKHPPVEEEQPESGETLPKTTVKKHAMPPTEQQKKPETVSFFFDDADIFEVAQTVFADILKANYIIDPQVKGRVNFRTVTPIPKDEVLPVMDIIFRLNGIGYVEEGGIYRIVPLAEVSKELIYSQIGKPPSKVAIEMFTFKNLDLKESMPDIENALGLHLKGGTVRIVPIDRLNALIVVASSKDELQYIKEWVETFDAMFATARPKIFVYPLQNSKAEHIASLLQSILGGSAPTTTGTAAQSKFAPTTRPGAGITQPRTSFGTTGTTGTTMAPITTGATAAPKTGTGATVTSSGTFVSANTKIFADEITNSLIVLATPADYKFIEDTIKKIDIMPRQVSIEGLIARVDLTDNLDFGLSWALKTDVKWSGLKPFTRGVDLNGTVAINPGGLTTTTPSGGFSFVGTDSKDNIRAVITALAAESRAKILAAPHILVSDNREARIQVGSQIPIATSSTSYVNVSGQTTTEIPTTNTIQYQDIGIILTVKPQVNDSGLISLDISQEISSEGPPATIGGTAYTSINKTEATTNLVAQDGQTIVIGGLIREDVTKSKDGIPFLSKLPIIGNLFGSTVDHTTRTELVILLTPHVVRNMQEAGGMTERYLNRYQQGTRDKEINNYIEKGNENGEKKKPE